MTVFIGIAALLTLLVLAWLLIPLLRSSHRSGISSEGINAAIHRDQLQALEADLARGVINQEDFEATRDELQLRLLDDTQSTPITAATSGKRLLSPKATAVMVALATPLLAVGLYLQLGNPALVEPVQSQHMGDQEIRAMIDKLAERQKANPTDLKGWTMLARSYRVMGRLEDARDAFEKAGSYIDTEPDALLDYAAVLGGLQGNRLEGKPVALIEQALKISPEHPNALMMLGIVAYQREDYAGAVKVWEQLLAMLDPNSEDAQQMQANIADARAQGKLPPADATKLPPVPAAAAGGMTPEMINQMVERLANRLKDNPDDHAGWARLANAYKVQGKLDEAAQAFSKTGPLLDTDANLISQYADLLATRAQGDFKGQPLTLINKALRIDPKQPHALMMAAQAALQRADYAQAISHWETVLTVLPADSPDSQQVKAEMADAKGKLGALGKP